MRFAVLAALLCASTSFGQVSVFPSGDLQAAVDLVPDGGYVLIHGGTYEPIQIVDKSVILFGVAPWSITTSVERMFNRISLFGFTYQPSPIEVTGNSSHWIYVSGARLGSGGRVGGYGIPAFGLHADGLGLVYVIDTIAEGASCFWDPGSSCEGSSGILAERVQTVVVERSYIAGSISQAAGSSIPPPAPPAIKAHGGTVVMIFAWAKGGDGARINIPSPSPPPTLCPCPGMGGHGGNAVESAALSTQWVILEPGAGGLAYWLDSSYVYHPWGQQPPGLPFVQF